MSHDDRMRLEAIPRRLRRARCLVLTIVALVAATGSQVLAIDRRPLPTFAFTAADGSEADTSQIVRTGRWLLVYVRTDCRSCDDLLRVVRHEDEAVAGRLVVVVGGANATRLAAFKAAFPDLARAAWFGDPKGGLPPAIGLPGAPAVFGLTDRTIVWSRTGALKTNAETLALLQSWVKSS